MMLQLGTPMMAWPGQQLQQTSSTLTGQQLDQVKSVVQDVLSERIDYRVHTTIVKYRPSPKPDDRPSVIRNQRVSLMPNSGGKCNGTNGVPDTGLSLSHTNIEKGVVTGNLPSTKRDKISSLGKNVVNLSQYKLSPCELSLLDKGLSFIPSVQHTTTHTDVIADLQTMERKYIDRYANVNEMPSRACRLLKSCMASIRYDFKSLRIKSMKNNLSREECRALKCLIKNRDLVISKADKGDATVVMNVTHYLELAYKHLGDETRYLVLNSDPPLSLRRDSTPT